MPSDVAKYIFELHYQARDEHGELKEHSTEDVIERVCSEYRTVLHRKMGMESGRALSTTNRLKELQNEQLFSFNSPLYYNFGIQKEPVLAACYVAHLEDSVRDANGIADNIGRALYIFKSGAGIGIPIWRLRPKGCSLGDGGFNIQGKTGSSGALSWMDTFNVCGETVKAAGKRRAGIFMCMPVWHPDIIEFITIKSTEQRSRFLNMNLSVVITDDFMQAVADNTDWKLEWRGVQYPVTRDYTGPEPVNGPMTIKARELLDMIAKAAWKCGDPGILFLDEVNRFNMAPSLGPIDSANVCGEQTLNRDTSCNLGAINLYSLIKKIGVGSSKLKLMKAIKDIVHKVMPFLDANVDITSYPDDRFKKNSVFTRNVGLGISGFGEMLAAIRVPYASSSAREAGRLIMEELTLSAWEWGYKVVKEGATPAKCFDVEMNQKAFVSILEHYSKQTGAITRRWNALIRKAKAGLFPRNSNVTTIAPTGNTGLAFDTGTGGCEPIFALAYKRSITGGKVLHMLDPEFQSYLAETKSDVTVEDVVKANGSAADLDVPDNIKKVFATAREINWRDRVEMQGALQLFCTSAISSTVNLPEEATVKDVLEVYKLSHKLGCKGITLFRPGWIQGVLVTGTETVWKKPERPIRLSGDTFKVRLSTASKDYKIYVTINKDNGGKPIEVFVNIGDSGTELQAWAQALGRFISIGLQYGIPPELIVKHVIGIQGSMFGWIRLAEGDKKPKAIKSGPAVIGHLLQRYYLDEEGVENIEEPGAELCPRCQNRTFLADKDGCWHCTNKKCNHSRGCGG